MEQYHGLSACTGVNPLAKARRLSSRTGGLTMGVNPLFKAHELSPRTGGQTMVQMYNTVDSRYLELEWTL